MEQPKYDEPVEDAVLIAPVRLPDNRNYIRAIRVVSAMILVTPLLIGGKDDYVISFLKIVIFSVAALVLYQDKVSLPRSKATRALLLACAGVLVVTLVQLCPLPISLVSILSAATAKLYQDVGASVAFISLEPYLTLSSATWFAAICVLFFGLLAAPRGLTTSQYALDKVSSRHRNSPHVGYLEATKRDVIHEQLERAIIVSGTLCAVIALAHWATANDALFGIFGEGRTASTRRAHWPFANPNHLSVLLQMALILTATRLISQIYYGQLQLERLFSSSTSRKFQRERVLSVVSLSLSLCIMGLANVLTVSRMGNVLMVLGFAILWFIFQRNARFVREPAIARPKDINSTIRQYWARARTPLAAALCAIVVLFFIGQKGREIASERVEHGLAANYDQVRSILATTSLEVLRDFPVFGVGLGCWHLGVQKYAPESLGGWTLDYAHNEYLQFFAELGVLGIPAVILFGITLFALIKRAYNSTSLSMQRIVLTGYVLAIALPLIHATVDFPFHIPGTVIPFVALLAIVIRYSEGLSD